MVGNCIEVHSSTVKRRNFDQKSHGSSENESSFSQAIILKTLFESSINAASFISFTFLVPFIVKVGQDAFFSSFILISPEPLELFHCFKPSSRTTLTSFKKHLSRFLLNRWV